MRDALPHFCFLFNNSHLSPLSLANGRNDEKNENMSFVNSDFRVFVMKRWNPVPTYPTSKRLGDLKINCKNSRLLSSRLGSSAISAGVYQ